MAEKVRVTFWDAPGLRLTDDPGEKPQVIPAGRLEQARFTVPVNPSALFDPAPLGLNTRISATEPPEVIETDGEFATMVNVG